MSGSARPCSCCAHLCGVATNLDDQWPVSDSSKTNFFRPYESDAPLVDRATPSPSPASTLCATTKFIAPGSWHVKRQLFRLQFRANTLLDVKHADFESCVYAEASVQACSEVHIAVFDRIIITLARCEDYGSESSASGLASDEAHVAGRCADFSRCQIKELQALTGRS